MRLMCTETATRLSGRVWRNMEHCSNPGQSGIDSHRIGEFSTPIWTPFLPLSLLVEILRFRMASREIFISFITRKIAGADRFSLTQMSVVVYIPTLKQYFIETLFHCDCEMIYEESYNDWFSHGILPDEWL
jgi:hypothetical protein